WGEPPGYAWGVLCLGTGARWGTLSLGDVETAARIFGPAAAAGSFAVHVGMGVAIGAALLSEARIDGLRSSPWATRVASLAAMLAAVQHGSASPATAATAAMAAFLIGSGIPPRRVAIPAIGAAAVIAAGAAGNAAIVLALWTVGTAAAVESRPRGQQGGRWA